MRRDPVDDRIRRPVLDTEQPGWAERQRLSVSTEASQQKERPPKRGRRFPIAQRKAGSLSRKHGELGLSPARPDVAESGEAKPQHRPGRGFGNGADGRRVGERSAGGFPRSAGLSWRSTPAKLASRGSAAGVAEHSRQLQADFVGVTRFIDSTVVSVSVNVSVAWPGPNRPRQDDLGAKRRPPGGTGVVSP